MDKIKKIGRSTKNFVLNHKGAVACVAVIGIHLHVVAKHNEFLKDHELFNEFYQITE